VVHVYGKRLDLVTPSTILFLPAMLNAVAHLQILNNITLRDKLYSVPRSNLSRENEAFGGKSIFCILKCQLVCTINLCSGLAGHVARMGEERGVHRMLVGKPEGRDRWGDPDVDGRIILRWMFRKLEGVVGTGWSWLRIGTVGGHL
jgi:hypothetical protein